MRSNQSGNGDVLGAPKKEPQRDKRTSRKSIRRLRNSPGAMIAWAAAVAVAELVSHPVEAAPLTHVLTAGGTGWQTATWTNGVPNAAGDVANYATATTATTLTLDSAVGGNQITLGGLTDTNTGAWTINTGTASGFTFDNTGGFLGDTFSLPNAQIATSSTGALTIAPNITISNTDLDIGVTNAGGSINISGNITATSNQNLNFRSTAAGTITIGGSIGASGSNITVNDYRTSGTTTITGALGSAVSSVNQLGTATLVLQGANTYTGNTIVDAGTLTVSGASGSINQSASYTLSGGLLNLDNTAGNADRVNDTAAVTIGEAGGLTLVGNAAATTTQNIGTLGIAAGSATVTLSPQTGFITTLAAGGFSRTANGTALVRGAALDQSNATTASRITLASQTGLALVGTNTLSNGGTIDTTLALQIVPYLFGDTSNTGTGTNFVTYDSTLGLRVLQAGEQTALTGGYSTATNPDNAVLNGTAASTTTIGSGVTLNSLLISTNATQMLAGSGSLTINSGAIAATAAGEIINNTFSGLTLGNGTWNEGVITTAGAASTLTVNTPISVTGSGGLTKTGAGTLTLGVANAINYIGQTTIDQGTLAPGVNNVFSASSPAILIDGGGTLNLGATSQTLPNITLNSNAVVSGATGTVIFGGTVTYDPTANPTVGGTISVGTLNLNGVQTFNVGKSSLDINVNSFASGTRDLSISSAITNGSLTKNGPGVLALTGISDTYSGATTVNAGTLYVLSNAGPSNSAITVNPGATFAAQASPAAGSTSFAMGASLTLNSGNAVFGTADNPNSANGRNNKYTFSGALTLASGSNTVSLNHTQNGNFGSYILFNGGLSRTAGSTVLFRGKQLSAGAEGTNAGNDAIQFNTALGTQLVGGGGTIGTTTTSILPYAIGDTGDLQGSYYFHNGLGTDFVTYNTTGNVGIQLLTTYANSISGTSTSNVKVTDSTIAGLSGSNSVNSLILTSATAGAGAPGTSGVDGTGTLTVTSGAILTTTTSTAASVGESNGNIGGFFTNNATIGTSGLTLAFGSAEAIITTAGPSTLTDASTSGGITGTGGLTKSGAGTLNLNAADTISGAANINAGAVVIGNSLALQNATLNYNNQGGAISFGSQTGATLGGLTGAQNLALTNASSSAVALTVGSSSNLNSSYSGALTGAGSLTKAGTGTFTLLGGNTFSGTTTVNSGILRVNGTITNSAVTVNPGGTLSGSGTIGGSVTLTSGNSAINLQDAAIDTLTLNGGLTLNNGNQLSYDVGSSADRLSLSGGFSASGTTSINVTNLTGFGVNTYTLLSGTGLSNAGPATSGVGPFSLNTTSLSGFALSLQLSSGNLQLVVNQVAPTAAYWYGSHDANWGTGSVSGMTNWVTGPHVTTDTGAIPAGVTDVHFAADNATNLATTLDQAFTINSLTFDNGVGTVSIGGSQNLTVTNGITQASGAGPATINTTGQVILGGDQTWTNNSASTLTVSSAVSGAHALITAGTGVIQLGGSNSYTNGTTVSSGTLQIANANALGAGSVTVNANLDLNGQTLSAGALSGNSSGVITNTNASPASITTNVASGTSTYAGAIQDGGGGAVTFAMAGTGSLVLSGSNTYTGGTSIAAGTLTVGTGGTNGTLGSGAINNNGTIIINHSDIVTIADPISGSGALQQSGTGTLALTGSNNNYSGTTTINSGTLQYSGNSSISANSALTVNGGALSLLSDSTATFTPSSFSLAGSGPYTIAVNELTGAGAGNTLSIANEAANGTTSTFINVSSTSGDTLAFSTVFQLNGVGAGAGATTFSLANANVILNGLSNTTSQTDGGMSVQSATGNSLTIKGTLSTASNRFFGITLSSGTLIDNISGYNGSSTNRGFFGNLNGGTWDLNSNQAVGGAGNGNKLTISGGTLDNTSGASVTLSNNPAVIINGDFAFSTAGSTSANNLNLGTGAISLGTTAGTTRTITTNGASTLTLGGVISNGTTANSLTKAGSGSLALSGISTYTGATTLAAGILNVAAAENPGTSGPLGNGGTIAFSGGTLQYSSANQYDYSGRFSTAAGQLYDVDTNGQNVTWATSLSSSTGSLTLSDSTGSGTLILSAASTYAGSTYISGGTLDVTGSIADSGSITVDATNRPATVILDGANAVLSTAPIMGIGPNGNLPVITVNANQTIASINSVGSTTFQNASTSTVGPIDDASVGQTSTLNVVNGSSLTAAHVRQGIVSIDSTSIVTIAPNGTSTATSVLTNLANSGTLDLKNNDLIVANDPGVGTLIANAYNHGAWNQPGITSSSALVHTGYNLGYATVGSGAGQLNIGTFDGQPVSTGYAVVKYTLNGDLNLDNSVDQNDIALLAPHYGTTSGATWYQGDVNHDGSVDQNDIALIAPNYGQTANAPGNALTLGIKSALTRSASPNFSSSGLSGGVTPALNHLYTWDAALPDATAGNVIIKVDNTTGDSHFGDVILQGNSATLYTLVITSASGSMNSGRYDSLNAQYNGGGGSEAATLQGLAVDNTTNHSGNFSVFSQTANKINEAGLGVTLDFTSNAESVDMSVKANNKNLFSGITADLAFSWSGQNGTLVSGAVEYSSPVTTPEPGMLGMLGVGGVMMMRRRRKAPCKEGGSK